MVPARTRSLPDCRPLLADHDDLTVLFQPVVDLARGTVAGYSATARFPGTAGPSVWFAAAADAGLAAEVEALLVHKALARLPWLPAGCGLIVPVRATLLTDDRVLEAFAVRPRLEGLVVEVVPDGADLDAAALGRAAGALRARGAHLAVATDAALAGGVLPEVVVVDRDAFGASADTGVVPGPVPGAPLVLADGIETPADLTAALQSGAALARGWLFGPPSAAFDALPAPVTELVRTHGARIRLVDPVLSLAHPVLRVPAGETAPAPAVEVDGTGAPVALLVAGSGGATWRKPVTLCVLLDAPAGETLRLALSRAPEHRHDPVLCVDEDGRPLGLVHVAELIRATAL